MIEQDLSRIAAALERIASHLDHPPAASARAGAPVEATVTAAPVASIKEARAAKAAPAAPVVQDQPELTLEGLRARMQALSASGPGRREQVIGVLRGLGVPTLTKLPADRYPDLVQGLDALEAA